jgi:Pyridoxal-phosphate dependent enzyme
VPIISTPQAFNEEDLYVDLRSILGQPLFLKCEGFNFAGSIKLKAAAEMVEAAERDELLTPESVLVESSSGNLGVAWPRSRRARVARARRRSPPGPAARRRPPHRHRSRRRPPWRPNARWTRAGRSRGGAAGRGVGRRSDMTGQPPPARPAGR